jgi:vitamin B12 transporter
MQMRISSDLILLLAFWSAMPFVASAQNSPNTTLQESDTQSKAGKYRIDDVEVVVTAARIETPAKEVASSISIITDRQMEELQKTSVLDVLRTIPSLDVAQAGGPGRTSSVYIRGAKSEHTLVLIDGVEMNDPMSTGRSYDFADLTTENIERIEILRGPQSTLYGSDAIGGVINIITKTGKGKPNGFVSFEGGSFNSFKESSGIGGGGRRLHYSFGFSRADTAGISVANENYGNSEKDGYRNMSFSGKFGITPAPNLNFDFVFRRIDAKTDLDNSGGAGGDDPNYTLSSKRHFFRTQTRLSLFKGLWNQKIGFSLTDHASHYRNDVDQGHPVDSMLDSYNGRMYKVDWQNDFQIRNANTLIFGLETEEERGSSAYFSKSAYGEYTSIFPNKAARTTGFYIQDQIRLRQRWFTTLGIRLDNHSQLGTKGTYHIASAYVFDRTGTKLKMSFGTGFKVPSLYQLYSIYGNEDLRPEKSTGWDAGIEQSFISGKVSAGATYFDNRFDDMVDFNSATYQYSNVSRAAARGLETSVSVLATNSLMLKGSYTYTDTKDKTTGQDLLRRARNKIGFNADYRFHSRWDFNMNLIQVGRRFDVDYSSYPYRRMELGGHMLVNLGTMYDLNEHMRIFGRIENLLNRDYEEFKGYGTAGISAFGGIKLLFR